VLPLPGYFLLQENQSAPFMIFKSTKNIVPVDFAAGAGDTFLVNSTSSPLASSTIETHPHRNYVMQWNFNVQRQLMSDTTLTVGYVGSRGIHLLMRGDDGNMTFPTLTPFGYQFGGPQTNSSLGVIRYIYWNTDSSYHALNVNLAKTMKTRLPVPGRLQLCKVTG